MAKLKRFNGKPMSHWEGMAKRLVVDALVRASLGFDKRSLPGEIASHRLMKIALAEDANLVKETLDEQSRWATGAALAFKSMLP